MITHSFVFDAIGTHWVIDIFEDRTGDQNAELFSTIQERIGLFDKTYSRFREDSLIAQISKTAGTYQFPDDAEELFMMYRTMYDATNGLFTPLIGNVLSDAGYDAQYSLVQKKKLSQPPSWEDVLEYHHPHLLVKEPVLLDFGACGKGYLVDLVGDILENHAVHSYCIDAGGDMLYKNNSQTPLTVGLENPHDTHTVVGTVSILNQSLCGSAGNRRVWGNFHHVINPHTLVSPQHITAIWVVAQNTILADALTTALYFVSPQTLQQQQVFEYCLLYADNSFDKSPGFMAELFLNA